MRYVGIDMHYLRAIDRWVGLRSEQAITSVPVLDT